MAGTSRERLIDAAFGLFAERGYEHTTVDEIAERAGVGRTTFFRQFRTKEEVIFPDHEALLRAIEARLATSSDETALVAVTEAVRLVLLRYLDEGDLARRRYALTSAVPALRDREIATGARYQRLFRSFLAAWLGRQTPHDAPHDAQDDVLVDLRAEVMASAVVAAHNHVLRRWLRATTEDPLAEMDVAMNLVLAQFAGPSRSGAEGTTVVAFRTGTGLAELVDPLRRLLAAGSGPT